MSLVSTTIILVSYSVGWLDLYHLLVGLSLLFSSNYNYFSLMSHFRYGKREAMAYAASRIQASYGTVKRVLSEVFKNIGMWHNY